MVDKESILDHLGKLEEALTDLERYQKTVTLADLEGDRDKRNMVLHALLLATQASIDIGNHLIAELHLERPETYRETFEVLNRAGLLSDPLSQSLAELAGLRNILVHLYWKLDLEEVYNVLKNDLPTFKEFAKIVKKKLEE
jgi:uncharacterized protein YutE (UPF0331/DUF86 family)